MALSLPPIQRCFAVAVLFLAGISGGWTAEFRDRYLDRETVTTDRGRLEGDNTGATVEPEEPRHAGKRSAHSLWISWVAPANGLATLQLDGRGFDTLLGVYQVDADDDPDDPELKRLERVAGNDDDRDVTGSFVQWGVRAGDRYEIAVDGFAGATGPLTLEWNLEPVDELIPQVTVVNGDRAATVGESVTLAVVVGPGDEPRLHWYFNDEELEDEEDLTLVIPNFQATHVGHYRVRIEVGRARFFSEPVELQISSEGVITALARNKPEDALDSPLQGGGPAPQAARSALARTGLGPLGGPGGVARGYNGTQIFNTVYAGRDLSEPVHCGVGGGASYWFAYAPPESGGLSLDTEGSAFDTVLAVYTYDPPLLGYASLRPVDCDDNGGANGRTSRLDFSCDTGRTYLIVVDGVNGARGVTQLNYRLQTNPVVIVKPPVLGPAPAPVVAPVGERVALTVTVSGTEPFQYLWRRGAVELLTETNATLVLDPIQLTHGAQYSVRVSNAAGFAELTPVPVSVWTPPGLVLSPDGRQVRIQFGVTGPASVALESAADVSDATWTSTLVAPSETGAVDLAVPLESAARFFRLRLD